MNSTASPTNAVAPPADGLSLHPPAPARFPQRGWLAGVALAATLLGLPASVRGQPSAVGAWSAPQPWVYPAIHASLLPTGKVLYWPGYTGDTPTIWDPATALLTDAPHAGYNIFCAGHAFDSHGRLVVSGGQLVLLFGVKDNALFDAFTGTWTRSAQMNYARWYPTCITLPSGDVLSIAGLDEQSITVPVPEIFRTETGRWQTLPNASLLLPWYPRAFVAPNGKVFFATTTSRYLDTAGQGSWSTVATRLVPGRDDYGSAVMYQPGKVIFIGGADPPVNTCEIIDLGSGGDSFLNTRETRNGRSTPPVWQATGSMARPRRQHNTTLLPDGKVLATGGSSEFGIDTESGKNLFAELWDPATGQWTLLAPEQVYRGYHSSALLLPDGRVLSAGGNGHPDAEVFSPPYLFQGARPAITAAPEYLSYDQSFTVSTPDGARIAKVTLTALGSATHAQNFGQRFIALDFKARGGALRANAPANANLAPPGYYLLWLIDNHGVPSVSKTVLLGKDEHHRQH